MNFSGILLFWVLAFIFLFTVSLLSHLVLSSHHDLQGEDGKEPTYLPELHSATTEEWSSKAFTESHEPLHLFLKPGSRGASNSTALQGSAGFRGHDPQRVYRTSALFSFLQHCTKCFHVKAWRSSLKIMWVVRIPSAQRFPICSFASAASHSQWDD